MIIHKTDLEGLLLIETEPKIDARGYFTRIFCQEELQNKGGIDYSIAQINHSFCKQKGTLRGMHYQKEPHGEDKIITCISGKIFDVAIDLRKNSKTYRKWFSIELKENDNLLICIPKGFAHGYQSLVNNSLIQYFVSEYYTPSHESGILWNDPLFSITWPLKNPFLSEKDQNWSLTNK